jgi:hypothetical protein
MITTTESISMFQIHNLSTVAQSRHPLAGRLTRMALMMRRAT